MQPHHFSGAVAKYLWNVIPEAIKQLITPSDSVFYALFNTVAVSVVKMTKCFNKTLQQNDPGAYKSTAYLHEIKAFYGDSQENYRQSIKRLSKVFITPIDQESVQQLSIDIHSLARGIYLAPRSISWDAEHKPDFYSIHFGKLLKKSAAELKQMIEEIGTVKRRFVMKQTRELSAMKRVMEIAHGNEMQS